MAQNTFSKRALLLASAMVLAVPAAASAADVTVAGGQTLTAQTAFGGTDHITVENNATISTAGQAALLMTSDATGAGVVISNAGTIQATGMGAFTIGMTPPKAGPISIINTGSIALGGAAGPVTITNSAPSPARAA